MVHASMNQKATESFIFAIIFYTARAFGSEHGPHGQQEVGSALTNAIEIVSSKTIGHPRAITVALRQKCIMSHPRTGTAMLPNI